jgi:hypothetical protein
MRNYARFLQRWYSVLTDSIDTADLFTADIANTFLSYAPSESSALEASWLTIAAGIFTAVGAFLPAAGSIPANGVAGVLTAAAGATGLADTDPAKDPRFDSFADLESSIGNMKLVVTGAITQYFNRLLVNTPPNNDWDKGTELARALEKGAFAEQDFGTRESSVDTAVMVRNIRASIISEAWNTGQVAIVKWSSDSDLATRFKYNPCFGGKRYGTDHAVACQFGKNYVIVSTGLQATVGILLYHDSWLTSYST